MHEVLVNRLGGLSLPRKSVVRLTYRPDMTLDVYRGRKTTMQQQQPNIPVLIAGVSLISNTIKRSNSGELWRQFSLLQRFSQVNIKISNMSVSSYNERS